MTDAEVLKHRMKPSNITKKADEIVNRFFSDKKPRRKKKASRQNKKLNYDREIKSPYHSTIDLRDDLGVASDPDMFERMHTFENTVDSLNEVDQHSPTFNSLTEIDLKGKAIMELSNLAGKLEGLVRELNGHIKYLDQNE
jgi:hypothetical protein